jgi:hypothetical protein
MVDPQELELLEHSRRFHDTLQVVFSGCAHSCCGRGWRRRDGYEQTYYGRVDNLHLPDGVNVGTFMLLSAGIGALSYVIAVRFDEVEAIALHEPSPLAA